MARRLTPGARVVLDEDFMGSEWVAVYTVAAWVHGENSTQHRIAVIGPRPDLYDDEPFTVPSKYLTPLDTPPSLSATDVAAWLLED